MGTSPIRTDGLNVALIIVACILGHIFPYGLLIASYAILGPAHYLTQMSWLHDRKYFTSSGKVLPVMCAISFLLLLSIFGLHVAQPWFGACLVSIAIAVAIASTLPSSRALIVGAAAGTVLLSFVTLFGPVAIILGILVPTILHVFVFTLSFMLLGGMRFRNRLAYLSVMVMLICAISFWWPVSKEATFGAHEAAEFFKPVVDSLKQFGIPLPSIQVFGFLSFAYTYHYANWFSKVEIIRWADVPRARMVAMAGAYAIVIGIYACSFTAGVLVSLVLSNLHVLLEFPLNLRTFGALSRITFMRVGLVKS